VYDWAAPISALDWASEARRTTTYWLYNASSAKNPSATLIDDKFLSLTGIRIDLVTTVGQRFDDLGWDAFMPLKEHWEGIFGLPSKRDEAYIAGGTRGDAFWRTLIRNRINLN